MLSVRPFLYMWPCGFRVCTDVCIHKDVNVQLTCVYTRGDLGFSAYQVKDTNTVDSETAYIHLFIMVGAVTLDSIACYARRRKLLKKNAETWISGFKLFGLWPTLTPCSSYYQQLCPSRVPNLDGEQVNNSSFKFCTLRAGCLLLQHVFFKEFPLHWVTISLYIVHTQNPSAALKVGT